MIKINVNNQWTCGFVSMNQVQFSANRDNEWPDRFGQASLRRAALCRSGETEICQFEEVAGTELNGVEEGEDRMTDEKKRLS